MSPTNWVGSMRRFLAVALLATVILGYPLLTEGANSSCSALEKRWYTFSISLNDTSLVSSAVMRALVERGDGFFAAEFARKQNSELPPFVSCYYFYWRSFFDESLLSEIKVSF